jgi:hypothetical protein
VPVDIEIATALTEKTPGKTCFVVMPISTPEGSDSVYGDREHFAHVLDWLFIPAVESAGFRAITPVTQGAELIQAEIVRNLETADLVLCDISTLNANVFFELGIRTALDRPVCLVRDDKTLLIPFDTSTVNFHTYRALPGAWEVEAERDRLAAHITATVDRADDRNALWRYFGLTQRGKDAVEAIAESEEESLLQAVLTEVRRISSNVPNPVAAKAQGFLESEAKKALVSEDRNVQTLRVTISDFGREITVHARDTLLGKTYETLARLADDHGARVEVWTSGGEWILDKRPREYQERGPSAD